MMPLHVAITVGSPESCSRCKGNGHTLPCAFGFAFAASPSPSRSPSLLLLVLACSLLLPCNLYVAAAAAVFTPGITLAFTLLLSRLHRSSLGVAFAAAVALASYTSSLSLPTPLPSIPNRVPRNVVRHTTII